MDSSSYDSGLVATRCLYVFCIVILLFLLAFCHLACVLDYCSLFGPTMSTCNSCLHNSVEITSRTWQRMQFLMIFILPHGKYQTFLYSLYVSQHRGSRSIGVSNFCGSQRESCKIPTCRNCNDYESICDNNPFRSARVPKIVDGCSFLLVDY